MGPQRSISCYNLLTPPPSPGAIDCGTFYNDGTCVLSLGGDGEYLLTVSHVC
jgi:hypothetical protein